MPCTSIASAIPRSSGLLSGSPSHRSVGRRRGFTLIELLVVMAVMAALAAMTIPTLDWVRKRQARKSTRALIHAVAAGMATYQTKTWFVANTPLTDPVTGRTYRMWDVNSDGLIDGDPAVDAPSLPYPTAFAGPSRAYRGFATMAGRDLPDRSIDAGKRIVDAWKQPLRIRFDSAFGINGVGVWSTGPDKTEDPPGDPTPDDLTSWEGNSDG